MDLVSTVRKEGSRGGRGDFKWSEVQTSQHRENYLGHSLMAPVGRWQKNKDLSWYAKADGEGEGDDGLTPEERAAKERREEFQRIKQAEREALSKALGYEINENGPLALGSVGEASGANAVEVTSRKVGPTLEDQPEKKHKRRDHSRERRHRHHHHHSRERRDRSRSRSRDKRRKRYDETQDREDDGHRRRHATDRGHNAHSGYRSERHEGERHRRRRRSDEYQEASRKELRSPDRHYRRDGAKDYNDHERSRQRTNRLRSRSRSRGYPNDRRRSRSP